MPSALSTGEELSRSPCTPFESTLTLTAVPVWRSKTNASRRLFTSPLTMFEAVDVNATRRPSPLSEGWSLPPFAWLPSKPTLTRVVVFAWRSRMKMSFASFVSPSTRFVAADEKAT